MRPYKNSAVHHQRLGSLYRVWCRGRWDKKIAVVFHVGDENKLPCVLTQPCQTNNRAVVGGQGLLKVQEGVNKSFDNTGLNRCVSAAVFEANV